MAKSWELREHADAKQRRQRRATRRVEIDAKPPSSPDFRLLVGTLLGVLLCLAFLSSSDRSSSLPERSGQVMVIQRWKGSVRASDRGGRPLSLRRLRLPVPCRIDADPEAFVELCPLMEGPRFLLLGEGSLSLDGLRRGGTGRLQVTVTLDRGRLICEGQEGGSLHLRSRAGLDLWSRGARLHLESREKGDRIIVDRGEARIAIDRGFRRLREGFETTREPDGSLDAPRPSQEDLRSWLP